MTKPDNKTQTPFSLRLTPQERQQLEKRAAGMSMAAYIKSRLFGPGGDFEARQTRGKFPVKDYRALAALLALFGHSKIAPSLRELAELARTGCLLVTLDTETAIQQACRDLAAIRAMLIRALGLEP